MRASGIAWKANLINLAEQAENTVKFGNPITAKYHRDVILSIKTITCVILAGVVMS